MAQVLLAPQTRRGTLSWHVGASARVVEAIKFVGGGMSLVLTGEPGAKTAQRLRAAGVTAELRIDPLGYGPQAIIQENTLFPAEIDWLDLQQRASATRLSPGTYVGPPGDGHDLSAALDQQRRWAAGNTDVTLQIAVHWSWLTSGRINLDRAVRSIDHPVALLLADSNDPLSHAGAVNGLAELVEANPTLSLHRCDLGALGFVALGGIHGAIGVGTGLRHFVPPDKNAGGAIGDRSPSVFLPDLMTFIKGSRLAGLAAGDRTDRFRCHEPGCDGLAYREFRDPNLHPIAVAHNRHAIERVVAQVLACGANERFSKFQELCQKAIVSAVALSGELRQDIAQNPQLVAWAELS